MYQQLQVLALIGWLDAQSKLEDGRDSLRRRLSAEDGMTTETVIITAVLATLALAVGVIVTTKITSKANSIPTD